MTTLERLEDRAIHLIGGRERRLFLMDDDGAYWVRTDMTRAEAEATADSLASWLHHALKGKHLRSFSAARMYDDGQVVPR